MNAKPYKIYQDFVVNSQSTKIMVEFTIISQSGNFFIYIYIYHYTSTPSIRGLCALSQFWWGRKPECPEETLEVKLRSTETQSTYNICSWGGRRDRCSQRQPDFPCWVVNLSWLCLIVWALEICWCVMHSRWSLFNLPCLVIFGLSFMGGLPWVYHV